MHIQFWVGALGDRWASNTFCLGPFVDGAAAWTKQVLCALTKNLSGQVT